jgi:ketosteroid isomerase-like protein
MNTNLAVAEREVWAMVQALNRAWTSDAQPERLVDYFAEEMIAITPTDRERRTGRADCVAGWTDFVRSARILRFVEKNVQVLMLADGAAAVVAYDFEIDWEAGGRRIAMTGRDLMTLERRGERWWLVADHYSPFPG